MLLNNSTSASSARAIWAPLVTAGKDFAVGSLMAIRIRRMGRMSVCSEVSELGFRMPLECHPRDSYQYVRKMPAALADAALYLGFSAWLRGACARSIVRGQSLSNWAVRL